MFLEFYDTGSGGIVKGSSSWIYVLYHKVEYARDGRRLNLTEVGRVSRAGGLALFPKTPLPGRCCWRRAVEAGRW